MTKVVIFYCSTKHNLSFSAFFRSKVGFYSFFYYLCVKIALLLYMSLKDISTYRSEMMGWAIIWIVALHFGFYTLKPLGFLAQYGYAGVEIFFFLSGFGIFYSLDKASSLIDYFKKRLIRIFPAYYLVGIVASFLVFHDTILQFLFRYTTIGFWTGTAYFEWYVPSILLLYLLAPLLKQIGVIGQGVLALLLLLVSYHVLGREDLIDGVHYFLLYRIPAFLLGMICAQCVKDAKNSNWFGIVAFAGIPVFIWLFPKHHEVYMYKYYSVFFLLPFFLIIFVVLSKYVRVLNPFMSRVGQASLEIYLIQNAIFCMLLNGVIPRSDITTLLVLVFAIGTGILLHEGIERLEKSCL